MMSEGAHQTDVNHEQSEQEASAGAADTNDDSVSMTDDVEPSAGDGAVATSSSKSDGKQVKLNKKQKEKQKKKKRQQKRKRRQEQRKSGEAQSEPNSVEPNAKRAKVAGEAKPGVVPFHGMVRRGKLVPEAELISLPDDASDFELDEDDESDGDRSDGSLAGAEVVDDPPHSTLLREQEARLLEIDNAIGSFPGRPSDDFEAKHEASASTSIQEAEEESEMLASDSDSDYEVHTTSQGNVQLREKPRDEEPRIDLTDEVQSVDQSSEVSSKTDDDIGRQRASTRERRLPDTHFFAMNVPNMPASTPDTEDLELFLRREEEKEMPDFAIKKKAFSHVAQAALCSITNSKPIEIDGEDGMCDDGGDEAPSSSSDASKPKVQTSNFRYHTSAMVALQEASEKYLVDLFREASLYAHSRGSATVTPRDFDLVFDVRKLYRDLHLEVNP